MRMAEKSLLDSSEQASVLTQLVDPGIDLQQESDRWQQLLFSTDMGDSQNNNRNTTPRPRSASAGAGSTSHPPQNPADVEGAVLLAQFAAAMQYPGQDPNHPSAAALRNLMNLQQQYSSYTPQPASPNLLNPGPSWLPAQSYHQQPFGATQFQHPVLPPINPAAVAGPSSFPVNSPTSTIDPDETTAVAEDKRRRNTAASARFRIKKKQRTLNLERSVSDLTGRAEELEREAADLRRENGWLKEIVMLKGSRLSGMDLTPDMLSTAEISRGSSSKKAESQSDSEQDSSEGEQHHGRKGKGKAKSKEK